MAAENMRGKEEGGRPGGREDKKQKKDTESGKWQLFSPNTNIRGRNGHGGETIMEPVNDGDSFYTDVEEEKMGGLKGGEAT